MKIKFEEITLNILLRTDEYSEEKIPVIFLHGFTGQASDWNPFIKKLEDKFFPIAIDIVGHGESDSPEKLTYYTENSLIEQVDTVINHFNTERVILCGYSMGGRLALSYTLANPEKIRGVILESSTPGIENKELRKERIENDRLLSEMIMLDGVEKFINNWLKLPLFNSLWDKPDIDKENIIKLRKQNKSIGLSNSLKGFGTGGMKNHWKEINNLSVKTLLITGDSDKKFTDINNRMASEIPDSVHKIIKNCGHNTHLENPEDFFILVSSFLRTFIS